jgi:hypothetical protein
MSRTSPTIIRRATTKPYILGIPTYPHLLPLLWCKELYPYVLSSCSIPHVWQISTVAEAEHAILELASLLDAEVRVTEIILQALQARIVGLKKVVWLGWLLVAGWVRGCARLMLVHSGLPFCGPGPGRRLPRRGRFYLRSYFSILLVLCKSFSGIIWGAD